MYNIKLTEYVPEPNESAIVFAAAFVSPSSFAERSVSSESITFLSRNSVIKSSMRMILDVWFFLFKVQKRFGGIRGFIEKD